ncbi:hypothetical protein [Streptomyces sp. TRM70350]|uniref:hypothetical protein n=1 Tax=Streptomyces sp. TRM70350 TaxID=2856165 RepID=UPI001C48C85C|nr:hypothetical protein [Streptomyces sp. TRM70350]MBV7698571.1 hypothetical protein [Streptomyces sp. TRM70350]
MRIVAAVVSALLILEFSLAALTWTPALSVAVDRFSSLTRISPAPGLMFLIGMLDLIGVIGVVAGFWKPLPAVLAGCWFALLCGWILYRQTIHGDRGSSLVPYTLFSSAAVILVVTRLAERA